MRQVLLDGSPVSPPNRFASVIARHRVSLLKAGSTFLRMLMSRDDALEVFAPYDLSSLRLGTFCAEPVNEAVHRFAMAHLTRNYINSYWATEHGGMVWSRCYADEQPLRPDARTWPLPWIDGAVMVARGEGSQADWRISHEGEQGEVVIRRAYPYLALTIWCGMQLCSDAAPPHSNPPHPTPLPTYPTPKFQWPPPCPCPAGLRKALVRASGAAPSVAGPATSMLEPATSRATRRSGTPTARTPSTADRMR